MENQQVLFLCSSRGCNNFKFEHDDEWLDATEKGIMRFFVEKVRAKIYKIERVLCPDCVGKHMAFAKKKGINTTSSTFFYHSGFRPFT